MDDKLGGGAAAVAVVEQLAALRLCVFREFPYLYEGNEAYERRYLQTYINAPRSLCLLVKDGDAIVGASTALPLADESSEFQQPFVAAAAGAELILAPSCTDSEAGYQRVRIGAQARALENQIAVLQSPTVGAAPWSPALDINVGRAALYTPPDYGLPASGVVAESAELSPARSQWLLADLDLEAVRRVRSEGQVFISRDWPLQSDALRGGMRLVRG